MDSEECGTPTHRLVAGEWGCPALPPSFFGKKFWTIFLAFSKVFQKFLDTSSPSSVMSTSTKCGCRLGVVDTGRPSSVCQSLEGGQKVLAPGSVLAAFVSAH